MNGIELALVALLVITLLTLGLATVALAQVRRQKALTQSLYARLHRELNLANSGAIGMGQRLLAMEKRLQQGTQSASDGALQEGFQPYADATQLLDAGIDNEEVARRCGLSRAEVSLLAAVHRQNAHHNG